MSNTTRLVAVNAGLSDPSSTRMLVDRLVEAATGMATSRGDRIDVEVIDLRDLAVDIGRSLAGGFPSGTVADAIRHVERADALIAATPVFNASYAGLFKSFFDLVDVDAMRDKPVLIAATGGSPRHSMVLDHALRPLFAYLRTVVVPTGVYAAAEDWAGGSTDTVPLADRITRAAAQLVALTPPRAGASTSSDPVSSSRPADRQEADGIANFARLLGGA
ncbi:CE1759 family FMN reductase [Gordonia sp. NPDC003429]